MKKFIKIISLFLFVIFVTVSCETDNNDVEQEIATQAIPDNIIKKLKKAGFYTEYGLSKYKNGYIVETDIFLTEAQIDELLTGIQPETGTINSKQYRTNRLVSINGASRTLNVFFDPGFNQFMQSSFDAALQRYNNLDLKLRFKRTNNRNNNDIQILLGNFSDPKILGKAGFPSRGNPKKEITLSRSHFNTGTNRSDATTVIAHEIGHAIGFRHTDFRNRAFSCGGSPEDEGSTSIGANYIPGTPSGPDANSWMLACSSGRNRSFTDGDQAALIAIYGNSTVDPTATLNRTTGEFRAKPGAQIKLTYSGNFITFCAPQGESLSIGIIGVKPTNIYDYISWSPNPSYANIRNSGSLVFRMPASGIVKVDASLTTVGCSVASITLNENQRINLGNRNGGNFRFP
ncbi:M57 family metalloprotease [Aquimarina sp. RZ0]|uniref:M57 family metalloprotease n=1 Tax=Aquimarina sp. RZ0 TaxID=2607730 RepID=UPI0011F35566|nr:M57 family metalloprotease [Aquimarina sp. RZ0]KAA1245262.1 hypothetical protein F0000_12820 [Aquimarina sp. RZ0]